ncbi:hypothetical protein [Mesorhizobium sp. Z1-4]|uniref:hypothetical protein n=1 Tax=Mesorhizobium sp. Z1-4 TaxID=2448478 RepID=UPI000FD78173|nr:hypothetical protein [Mesorhizobium sp. Z1-4]
MKRSIVPVMALGLSASLALPAAAQELPPVAVYQAMLDANKASGWVQFREFGGRQLVYFTPLQTMHCRLSEIRYSVNSEALDRTFPLVDCVPALPFSLPSDAGLEAIAIELAPGEAKSVTVQVVWSDGAESEALTFVPCEGVGDQSCAQPAP